MNDSILLFNTEVKQKTKVYHIINIVFWILSLIGSFVIAESLATVTTINEGYFISESTQTDSVMMVSIFAGLALLYTLLFIFVRVTIQSYGEKIRTNYYNQLVLDRLVDMSK